MIVHANFMLIYVNIIKKILKKNVFYQTQTQNYKTTTTT